MAEFRGSLHQHAIVKYIPKYCILNEAGEVLVRTTDRELKLVFIAEEDLLADKDVCFFNSPEAAENYIWKYQYLEIDPTLRPFQI